MAMQPLASCRTTACTRATTRPRPAVACRRAARFSSMRGSSTATLVGPRPRTTTTVARAAAASTLDADTDDDLLPYTGESFYDLLGCSPEATPRAIKAAYYSVMRDCHPDRSMGDESTEFCMMLNDIYDTLMDPERRALYDELAGFSADAVNPFLDTSHERELVFVDEFSCIGCRNCNNVCSRTFEMEDEWGRARAMRQNVDTPAKLQEAIDTCPVSCIHWVSGPQLSLLEAAMARMERVAVWSMMMSNGANKDVFTEASMAWEKRFARTQARKAAAAAAAAQAAWEAEEGVSSSNGSGNGDAQQQGGWGGFFSRMRGSAAEAATGSTFYERTSKAKAKADAQNAARAASGEGASVPETKDARTIATLAARAARASRSWKVYQGVVKARRGVLQLATTTSSSDDL